MYIMKSTQNNFKYILNILKGQVFVILINLLNIFFIIYINFLNFLLNY